MTTNVYDVKAGVLASDSRWSYTIKDGETLIAVVYSDDTGFDKIEVHESVCALFAGNSKLIDDWKQWIRSPNKIVLPRPRVEDGFAMCLVNMANNRIAFEHGQKIIDDEKYRFAGTGAKPAHSCWTVNKDPIRAVKSASKADRYSGGEVKFIQLKDKQHNTKPDGLFDSINKTICERGIVMYVTYEGKTVPIQDAAKTDLRIRDLTMKIARGETSAEAPSGLDPIVWTESDVKRLDAALEECFGPIAK
jgi:hypothetical protein